MVLAENCCLRSDRALERVRIQPQAVNQAQFRKKINFMFTKDLYLLLGWRMLLEG